MVVIVTPVWFKDYYIQSWRYLFCPPLRVIFISSVGRLFQVEYAMEAISHAGTSIGILAKDGILLAAEKKITSKLLDPRQAQEKIFTISE